MTASSGTGPSSEYPDLSPVRGLAGLLKGMLLDLEPEGLAARRLPDTALLAVGEELSVGNLLSPRVLIVAMCADVLAQECKHLLAEVSRAGGPSPPTG